MVRVKVVVETHVVLIAIRVLTIAVGDIHAFVSTEPAVAGDIQAVAESGRGRKLQTGPATREIVGRGHLGNELLDVTSCVELRSVVVPWSKDAAHVASKNAHRLERACRAGWRHRISV